MNSRGASVEDSSPLSLEQLKVFQNCYKPKYKRRCRDLMQQIMSVHEMLLRQCAKPRNLRTCLALADNTRELLSTANPAENK